MNIKQLEIFVAIANNGSISKGSEAAFITQSTASQASNCDISLLPGQPPELLQHRTRPDEPTRWSLMDLTAPEGNYAALAVRGDALVIGYLH